MRTPAQLSEVGIDNARLGTRVAMNDFGFNNHFANHSGAGSDASQGCEAKHDHHVNDWMPRFRHVAPPDPMEEFIPPPTGRDERRRRRELVYVEVDERDERLRYRDDDRYVRRYRDDDRPTRVRRDRDDDRPTRVRRYRDDDQPTRARRYRDDDQPTRVRRDRDDDRIERVRDDRPVRIANERGLPVRSSRAKSSRGGWSAKAFLPAIAGAGLAAFGVFFGFASVAEIAQHGSGSMFPSLLGLVGGVGATGLGGAMIANARRD